MQSLLSAGSAIAGAVVAGWFLLRQQRKAREHAIEELNLRRAWDLADRRAAQLSEAHMSALRAMDQVSWFATSATSRLPGEPVYPFDRQMRDAVSALSLVAGELCVRAALDAVAKASDLGALERSDPRRGEALRGYAAARAQYVKLARGEIARAVTSGP